MPWLGPFFAAILLATAPAVRVATVQVAPTAPPIVAPDWSRCPEWYTVTLDAGFTEEQWPTVDRVMWCESKCQPTAHNSSGASGLMQIMPFHWHGRDPYDPAVNMIMAKEVHDGQGWGAWDCF